MKRSKIISTPLSKFNVGDKAKWQSIEVAIKRKFYRDKPGFSYNPSGAIVGWYYRVDTFFGLIPEEELTIW